jgi:hypothetical protein
MLKVEMPLLEEGNPKHYHESFIKYCPMLLMFKENQSMKNKVAVDLRMSRSIMNC